MDESELHMKALVALRSGKLPNGRPARMWGGPGSGAECAVCGVQLAAGEVGLDVEFLVPGDVGPSRISHAFHVRCFAAWEHACGPMRDPTLAPVEVSVVEAHIQECADCRQELGTLRPLIDALSTSAIDVMRPASSLWTRLAARIALEVDNGRPITASSARCLICRRSCKTPSLRSRTQCA
jgi:hypothetical protein